MSEPFVFDSRCSLCKTPYGAVPCGQTITLHVRPLLREGFDGCSLVLSCEFSGRQEELPLKADGLDGERRRFSVTFSAPERPDLCWYHFRFWRNDGSGCRLDRSGYRSDSRCEDWQLTVYRARPTPEWFGSGVTYQIFPDRFCRLTIPDSRSIQGERKVHTEWNDLPQWEPDPDGETRCHDFFGGSLAGIRSKLSYLQALGVTVLYLCPIFSSESNHRYNTADYLTIDPMLGTEADFRTLCADARLLGIRIILDGVFNHTGSDSIYFNAQGRYSSLGAFQSQESPYYPWYRFTHWPDAYESWWGIRTLPAVDESNLSYQNFIYREPDSVVRHWLRAGASGWRLDVADELPDFFLAGLRDAVEETDPDALLLGEVWEDGTTKIAYDQRRRYLLGDEVHGLMNYPFRSAAISWLLGGDAAAFCESMETLREHYPRPAFYSSMNFLGTHDTPRILTLLGAGHTPERRSDRALFRLSPEEYTLGTQRLKVGAVLLFAFPGSPTIFYGDEVGMQGFEDPLNRGPYPWGNEDSSLLSWFSSLGRLRRERRALQCGDLTWLLASGGTMIFSRQTADDKIWAVLHAGDTTESAALSWSAPYARDLLSGRLIRAQENTLHVTLPPRSSLLLEEA